MNYAGLIGIGVTVMLAVSGFFSSAISSVSTKVDANDKAINTKVDSYQIQTVDRLSSLDANVANIKESLKSINSKLK